MHRKRPRKSRVESDETFAPENSKVSSKCEGFSTFLDVRVITGNSLDYLELIHVFIGWLSV